MSLSKLLQEQQSDGGNPDALRDGGRPPLAVGVPSGAVHFADSTPSVPLAAFGFSTQPGQPRADGPVAETHPDDPSHSQLREALQGGLGQPGGQRAEQLLSSKTQTLAGGSA